MATPDDLTNLSDHEVFARSREVMEELKRRELVSSVNSNPVGGYAEALVARRYETRPLEGRDDGYDVVRPDTGARVQVKGRRYPEGRRATHFSDFDLLDQRRFDEFVGVVLNEDYSVKVAWHMPWETVDRLARPVHGKHRLYIGHVEKAVREGDDSIAEIEL